MIVKSKSALSGGVAWVASSPFGPRINFAPPDEKGNGGAGNDGDGDDDAGGAGDDAGGGDQNGGDKSGGVKMGGLFARRSGQQQDDKAGDDKAAGNDEPGADGRPAGLPEKFWDAKTKAIKSDDLVKAYSELERAHGQLKRSKGGGDVPEDAKEYFGDKVEIPPEADRFAGLAPDDPGLKSWAETCKEEGIGKAMAQRLMTKMLVKMNDHAPMPIDPEQEWEALGKNAAGITDAVYTWIDGSVAAGKLSEDDVEIAEGLANTAKGMRFLARMRAISGGDPIPVNIGDGTRGMTREQWNDAMKDAIKAKDYREQERLEELGKMINGEEASHGGRPGGFTAEKTVARR